MERRNTIQKELVLRAVLAMQGHVTADEVYNFIRKEHSAIGKGTVYRNLGILAEEMKINRVENPGGPDCFDAVVKKHYHVRCIDCGKLFDVDMDEVADLDKKIRDTHGIRFLTYDILFKGICPDCQQKAEAEASIKAEAKANTKTEAEVKAKANTKTEAEVMTEA